MINISKLYCGLGGESDHLRYNPNNNFGPVAVYNCTAKCNLKCLHCYSSADDHQDTSELSTAQAKDLLDQLKEANCPVVLFSGGEPLLRKDFFQLLDYAAQIGLRTVISTNGTMIDKQTAQKLKQAKIGYAGISLDGIEQVHDKFRGVKGCYEKTLQGIANCQQADIKTGLRFTINRHNKDHVPFVFEIAKQAGVRRICFYHLIRSGRAEEMAEQSLTAAETLETVDTIIDKTYEYTSAGLVDEVLTVGNHADGPYLLMRMQQEGKDWQKAKEFLEINGGNKIGEKIAAISWNGNVYADQFWRNYCLGNVTEKRFADIWSDENEPVLQKLRNKKTFADKRCLGCKWFELCRGNYRFLDENSSDENWLNEPACYLSDEDILN